MHALLLSRVKKVAAFSVHMGQISGWLRSIYRDVSVVFCFIFRTFKISSSNFELDFCIVALSGEKTPQGRACSLTFPKRGSFKLRSKCLNHSS